MAEQRGDGDDGVVIEAERLGQGRCEVLAALCLAVTATFMLRAYSLAGALGQLPDGSFDDLSPWELVEIAAGGATLYTVQIEGVAALATLVLAYLLVVEIGPGSSIGRVGTRVLQGVVAVGALLTLSGVVATVAAVRKQGQVEQFASGGPFGEGEGADTLTTVLDRGGSALPVIAGAAVAAYVAWLASTALIELRHGPDIEDDRDDRDHDPYGADVDPYGADAD